MVSAGPQEYQGGEGVNFAWQVVVSLRKGGGGVNSYGKMIFFALKNGKFFSALTRLAKKYLKRFGCDSSETM